jgi:DNA-binding winged helix-turn-helix (wHTH) protein
MSLMEKEIYEFGPFLLDPTERVLSCDGSIVSLTPKAFETLLCLVRNQGRVLTKDELLKQIWPDTFVEEVNLAVNISAIRKALGENPQAVRQVPLVPPVLRGDNPGPRIFFCLPQAVIWSRRRVV